ncbi:MAG: translation initiation factor IF-1 [Candidatus Omnitrophica bacterium]|nr:MAG: Translation initiation factor IF-1 [Candidatus Hinthialibacteria bacterium OLB16]MBE7488566.1 translation initiation factor IF-1 [bacterium]MBK7495805.1 translation initiation factor IF-1 [Candidatus Omnitrophota bacterium]MCE7908162.1 translation initiation factor IF-1 [Candidatus Omnitrophica bacterium COP1]MBV6481261.1 Translation initiation factor IF-1 [bacterium]
MTEHELRTAKVVKNLPNQLFELELGGGKRVKAHLADEMKLKFTRLLPGEEVKVEISPYDPGRGRIISRL